MKSVATLFGLGFFPYAPGTIASAVTMDSAAHVFPYPGWVAAFILFRFFDITKLGPVGWADRKHGPTGIMLDDLVAGFLAALGGAVLAFLAHKVFL